MQEEINLSQQLIEFFEEHRGEVYSKTELVDIFNVAARILRDKLTTLIKHNEIEFEKISCRVARKIYNNNGLKRGLRVYFLE